MRFSGRTALITGAARGIGLACARAFVGEGAQVMIADIDAATGSAAAAELGAAARFVPCDVGDAAQVSRLLENTLAWTGRLDVLVNNAAIIRSAEFLELSEADFDAVLRVNLKGAFLVAQAAARVMVAAGGGAVVNLSSVNGITAIPNQAPYNISKGGVDQLTRVMAVALADKGVRVNAVAPGSILTDLLKVVMQDDAARRKILSRTPLGRCGEPAEVARAVLFLASDEASYITGQILYLDGGRLALNYTVPVRDV
jgi:NAD(P)-dependent dehydrogenase (short-subunit alcohol dehydrogenase family)